MLVLKRFWAPLVLLAVLVFVGSIASARGVPARAARAAAPAADCQPFGAGACLEPFPNNLFTRPDQSSPTGLRVHLPAGAMPISRTGQRVSAAPYDRADGFSPGSAAIVHVPGLDNAAALARTGAAGVLDIGRSLRRDQPIVMIDERTGRRVALFSELDSNATTPAATDLLIHPAADLANGHTYVVALRRLRTSTGRLIPAPKWFSRLRDGRRLPASERSQAARYARIFAALRRAGIGRKGLYEAWDFTVASRANVTGRLLAIRNGAFARLGDHKLADGKVAGGAPAYTVTSTKTLSAQLRAVVGTFDVPCYLVQCGTSATTGFHYSSSKPDALPTQKRGNVGVANFECIIPSSAAAPAPARASLYGHGLFGSYADVEDAPIQALAVGHNMVLCGTDWWGLTQADESFAGTVVANLNRFPVIVDRLDQAVLNTMFLGRLMISPHGLATNPDFQTAGRSVLDTSQLYYDGNSQGGIMGGVVAAVSPDVRRAVLGVTGMDYGNMLLARSTDFATFSQLLRVFYPDQSSYPVILDLLDQLWDRADPDGYAPFISGGLPDTPRHQVLMQIAYGDFQVSMYAGAAEARSIGASAYEPALDPVRADNQNLFWGIPAIKHFPFHGSAVEIWDSGPGRVQSPPVGNVPPTPGPTNSDPHSDPRNTPAAQDQISDFLEPNGAVASVCGGQPCHASVYAP
ncbi:MAG TPA: hypothetical protein VFH80_31775 [Solirubrobacteraceae bacterium]|nr:hypothetical protein [Solirubrobacteraceae bacterium]